MLSENLSSIEIRLTPEFEAKFKALKKRYRNIQSDIKPIIKDLKTGSTLGDRLSGIDFIIMKVRIRNSDTKRGKSGGYRLIYWVVFNNLIVLLDIYSKSDQENITINEISQIIKNFKLIQEENNPDNS